MLGWRCCLSKAGRGWRRGRSICCGPGHMELLFLLVEARVFSSPSATSSCPRGLWGQLLPPWGMPQRDQSPSPARTTSLINQEGDGHAGSGYQGTGKLKPIFVSGEKKKKSSGLHTFCERENHLPTEYL